MDSYKFVLVQTGDIFDKGRRSRLLERVGVNHLQHVGEKFIPYDGIESDGSKLFVIARNNILHDVQI